MLRAHAAYGFQPPLMLSQVFVIPIWPINTTLPAAGHGSVIYEVYKKRCPGLRQAYQKGNVGVEAKNLNAPCRSWRAGSLAGVLAEDQDLIPSSYVEAQTHL